MVVVVSIVAKFDLGLLIKFSNFSRSRMFHWNCV